MSAAEGSDRTTEALCDAPGRDAEDESALAVPRRMLEHVAQLTERAARMQAELARKNAELVEANRRLGRANARMQDELLAAAAVQRTLLPSSLLQVPGLEQGWCLRPCDELAGDLLNFLRLDEDHLAFYVLDVAGHGVSPALLSVQVSRLLSPSMHESQVLKRRLQQPPWYELVEPSEVLRHLNRLFQAQDGPFQYFTMIYGLVHLASGGLRLAAAGHPGPVLVRGEAVPVQLTCRSSPIGLFEKLSVCEHELIMAPGDRIWLYSDGVTDVVDGRDRDLGVPRLLELIDAHAAQPPQRAVEAVMSSVLKWGHPARPEDDCSLLAIERREEVG